MCVLLFVYTLFFSAMLSGVITTVSKTFRVVTLGRHVRFNIRVFKKCGPTLAAPLVGIPKRHPNARPLSTATASKSLVEEAVLLGPPGSLSEYLKYAMHRDLNINSTVFVGSVYELQVKEYLEKDWPLPISNAKIVGGSGDRGLDIDAKMGQFRLLVQCKCYTTQRVDPKLLREIKGAIQDVPPHSAKKEVPLVAMVASTNGFTRQGRAEFDKATIPMIFLKFSRPKLTDVTKPYEAESWKWGEMVGWEANWAAQSIGLGADKIVKKKAVRKTKSRAVKSPVGDSVK